MLKTLTTGFELLWVPLGFLEPRYRPVTHEQKVDTTQARQAFCVN